MVEKESNDVVTKGGWGHLQTPPLSLTLHLYCPVWRSFIEKEMDKNSVETLLLLSRNWRKYLEGKKELWIQCGRWRDIGVITNDNVIVTCVVRVKGVVVEVGNIMIWPSKIKEPIGYGCMWHVGGKMSLRW